MSAVTTTPTEEVTTYTLQPQLVRIHHAEGTSLVGVRVTIHRHPDTARIHAVAHPVHDSHTEYVSEPWNSGERVRGAIMLAGTHDNSEYFHMLAPVLPPHLSQPPQR